MYNREVLEKIIEHVGVEDASKFCYLVSMMYDIKYNVCKTEEPLNEFDFERQWWLEASEELKKDIKIID